MSSIPDTEGHIARVRAFVGRAVMNLQDRARVHDASKLEEPELAAFDEATPKLAALEYGTEEYKQSLRDLGPALAHHFECNDHHPEHYGLPESAEGRKEGDPVGPGVAGMSAMALLEMVCDWRAASERTKQRADGDVYKKKSFEEGLAYNQKRFGYGEEVAQIIRNTARELGLCS